MGICCPLCFCYTLFACHFHHLILLRVLFNSAAFGNFDEGKEMARTVKRLLRKPGMQRIKSRSFYILEGFIHHWTSPLRASRGPLLNGYKIGLETGDVESAAFNSE